MVIKGVKHKLQPKKETPKQPEVVIKKAVNKVEPVIVEPILPEIKDEEILLEEEVLTDEED